MEKHHFEAIDEYAVDISMFDGKSHDGTPSIFSPTHDHLGKCPVKLTLLEHFFSTQVTIGPAYIPIKFPE